MQLLENEIDNDMLDRARSVLDQGCSGATRDFLEDLLWMGWGSSTAVREFQRQHLKEIIGLYRV